MMTFEQYLLSMPAFPEHTAPVLKQIYALLCEFCELGIPQLPMFNKRTIKDKESIDAYKMRSRKIVDEFLEPTIGGGSLYGLLELCHFDFGNLKQFNSIEELLLAGPRVSAILFLMLTYFDNIELVSAGQRIELILKLHEKYFLNEKTLFNQQEWQLLLATSQLHKLRTKEAVRQLGMGKTRREVLAWIELERPDLGVNENNFERRALFLFTREFNELLFEALSEEIVVKERKKLILEFFENSFYLESFFNHEINIVVLREHYASLARKLNCDIDLLINSFLIFYKCVRGSNTVAAGNHPSCDHLFEFGSDELNLCKLHYPYFKMLLSN